MDREKVKKFIQETEGLEELMGKGVPISYESENLARDIGFKITAEIERIYTLSDVERMSLKVGIGTLQALERLLASD